MFYRVSRADKIAANSVHVLCDQPHLYIKQKQQTLICCEQGEHREKPCSFQHVNTMILILVVTTQISCCIFVSFWNTVFSNMTSFQREVFHQNSSNINFITIKPTDYNLTTICILIPILYNTFKTLTMYKTLNHSRKIFPKPLSQNDKQFNTIEFRYFFFVFVALLHFQRKYTECIYTC